MAIINKGTAFSNGEQLSASKLNDLVDGATFGTDSVDNASTIVNANGAITVRDSGVTAAKLATGSVTTNKIVDANVTFAKLTDVIDDDTMDTATNTTLATSESIKAYVNGTSDLSTNGYQIFPSGLIMQWGTYNTAGTPAGNVTIDFPIHFTTACLNLSATLRQPLGSADGANTVSAELDDSLPLEKFTLGFDEHDVPAGDKYAWWQAIGY